MRSCERYMYDLIFETIQILMCSSHNISIFTNYVNYVITLEFTLNTFN